MKSRTPLMQILVFALLFAGCNEQSERHAYTGVLEGKAVRVPTLTGGQIIRLLADTGDHVQVGDTLAVIDTTELALSKRRLLAAMRELQIQQQTATASLRQTETELAYVRTKYERLLALQVKQSIAEQSVDDVKNLLERARTAHTAAKQQVLALDAKREQLDARIAILQKKLHDAVVTAPVQGVITESFFEPGEAAPPLSPVFEIIHLQTVEVKIYVSEKLLPSVQQGQSAQIHVDGRPEPFAGQVIWISPKAEFTPKSILTPETRTSLVYAVKISIPNPEGILKHGMPVEVVL